MREGKLSFVRCHRIILSALRLNFPGAMPFKLTLSSIIEGNTDADL